MVPGAGACARADAGGAGDPGGGGGRPAVPGAGPAVRGPRPTWWQRLLGVRHAPYDPAKDEIADELARVAAGLGDVADEIGLIRRAITGNLPLDLVRGAATRDEWTKEDST